MSNTKTVMSQAANTQGLPLDITDVFSTYLYTGTGAALTINNGIDLAGEGGLVWIKDRSQAINHVLQNTENGAGFYHYSDITNAMNTTYQSGAVSSFNSDGFSLGNFSGWNQSGNSHASWTFRKAPKFFDVVTFEITRDGSNNLSSTSSNVTISNGEVTVDHNLASPPAIWIQKNTSSTAAWYVRSTISGTVGGYGQLHGTNAWAGVGTWTFASTDTQVGLGNYGFFQSGTHTYVIYLFANNDGDGEFGPSGDQDIIKCGSYTGNGSGTAGPTVDLGFEPQWILTKRTNSTGYWTLVDAMRGMVVGGDDKLLYPHTSDAEQQSTRFVPSATGFQVNSTNAYVNASGGNYIYMAIRRGSLAPPESATEVFETKTYSGTGAAQTLTTSLNGSDMALTANRSNSGALNPGAYDRLRGDEYLQTSNTSAAIASGSYGISVLSNKQNTVDVGNFASASGQTYVGQIFKRAPGFFDVVAYPGDGVAGRTVSHNLGVAPEMIWVKRRNSTGHWYVYHTGMTGGSDALHSTARLNLTEAGFATQSWKNYDFTDAHFSLDNGADINGSGGTYVAYLFASLPGISKVGSYTGNGGASQDIDCGFTSGARFVMVKAASGTGDWWIWDTERGITAGNDSSMRLNTTDAEVTTLDFIDPLSSGFTVVGSDSSRNGSGIEYIFYAIA
jgi:hypothetical protein